MRSAMTNPEARQLDELGYLVLPAVMDPQWLAELRETVAFAREHLA